jgi:hypothetical protein
MADDTRDSKPEAVNTALGEMKLEEELAPEALALNGTLDEAPTPELYKRSPSTTSWQGRDTSQSPVKKDSSDETPKSEYDEETISGDISVTAEPGKTPKLIRKGSQKVVARPPPLFDHLPDATEEALSVFQVIKDCIYGSKYMGYSEHDPLDCDCAEEWSEYIWAPGVARY